MCKRQAQALSFLAQDPFGAAGAAAGSLLGLLCLREFCRVLVTPAAAGAAFELLAAGEGHAGAYWSYSEPRGMLGVVDRSQLLRIIDKTGQLLYRVQLPAEGTTIFLGWEKSGAGLAAVQRLLTACLHTSRCEQARFSRRCSGWAAPSSGSPRGRRTCSSGRGCSSPQRCSKTLSSSATLTSTPASPAGPTRAS